MIFPKSLLGVADGPNDARPKVVPAADEIEYLVSRRVQEKRIDREVAPKGILLWIFLKSHRGRMPPVHVLVIAAKRGYLDATAAAAHQYDAKMGSDPLGVGIQHQNVLGRRVRRDVEVFRCYS